MKYPHIDYSTHPAYAPYANLTHFDDDLIANEINFIDAIYLDFLILKKPSDDDLIDALKSIEKSFFCVLQHIRKQNTSIMGEEWIDAIIQWVMYDFEYEFIRKVFSRNEYQTASLSNEQKKQLCLIETQGMYISNLDPALYKEMQNHANEYKEELKKNALANRFNRSVINVTFNSPLWKTIKHAVKDVGIFEVLGELKQNSMTLLGAGLEYSCPEQSWYQGLYSAMNIPNSPTQYLHLDEGDCLPKSLIYLTSVSQSNGPTRAIPASNHWDISPCQIRMHKALDRVVGNRYAKFAHGSHYRPIARHVELRQVFMKLPKLFQGSSHFGDDVLAETSLAKELMKHEISYLSESSQALVFDGPHLLHRGSMVESGERLALQVIFRNKNQERIKSRINHETLIGEHIAIVKKYARKLALGYI